MEIMSMDHFETSFLDEEATTTSSPRIDIISVRCDSCDFEAIPSGIAPSTFRHYLEERIWLHSCGGRALWETAPNIMTFAKLAGLEAILRSGQLLGFAPEVIQQITDNEGNHPDL